MNPDRYMDRRSLGSPSARLGQDIGPPSLVRPSLTLEHLEHGHVVGAERVALDLLQAHGREAAPACSGGAGGRGVRRIVHAAL